MWVRIKAIKLPLPDFAASDLMVLLSTISDPFMSLNRKALTFGVSSVSSSGFFFWAATIGFGTVAG